MLRVKFENSKYANQVKKFTGLDHLAMIIMTWNLVVQGNRPRYLVYKDDGPFPRPIRCHPDTSAEPHHLRGEVE